VARLREQLRDRAERQLVDRRGRELGLPERVRPSSGKPARTCLKTAGSGFSGKSSRRRSLKSTETQPLLQEECAEGEMRSCAEIADCVRCSVRQQRRLQRGVVPPRCDVLRAIDRDLKQGRSASKRSSKFS
jgi:hypothetical protein